MSENRPPLSIVDAFAAEPGQGNRAAVVAVRETVPESWLAATARALALPATAFLWRRAPDRYAIRCFAPSGELKSCGHATLAAAHSLFATEHQPGRVVFETALGELPARPVATGVEITMPAEPISAWPVDRSVDDQLGAEVVESVRSTRHGLVRVADEELVRSLRPDLSALASLPVVGLAVTATGADGYDIVSRWFVPRLGLEDQATGTAHCLLGPYWNQRLGRDHLLAYQASANGAELSVIVDGGRVRLTGRALTLMTGSLAVDLLHHRPGAAS